MLVSGCVQFVSVLHEYIHCGVDPASIRPKSPTVAACGSTFLPVGLLASATQTPAVLLTHFKEPVRSGETHRWSTGFPRVTSPPPHSAQHYKFTPHPHSDCVYMVPGPRLDQPVDQLGPPASVSVCSSFPSVGRRKRSRFLPSDSRAKLPVWTQRWPCSRPSFVQRAQRTLGTGMSGVGGRTHARTCSHPHTGHNLFSSA